MTREGVGGRRTGRGLRGLGLAGACCAHGGDSRKTLALAGGSGWRCTRRYQAMVGLGRVLAVISGPCAPIPAWSGHRCDLHDQQIDLSAAVGAP